MGEEIGGSRPFVALAGEERIIFDGIPDEALEEAPHHRRKSAREAGE